MTDLRKAVKATVTHKCAGLIYPPGAFQGHLCGNGARYEDAGKWYCKTHHPPTIKEKIRARSQKWEQELREKQAKWAAEARERQERNRRAALFPELLEALTAIMTTIAKCERAEHWERARAVIAKAEGKA